MDYTDGTEAINFGDIGSLNLSIKIHLYGQITGDLLLLATLESEKCRAWYGFLHVN